jgi:hypothetical protein
MAIRRKILVIDNAAHELVRSAAGVARDSGHQVFSHPSPVGVGSALAQHHADTVLFAWELPAGQDHKLQNLVETWERFRTLKTVVLVAARSSELSQLLSRCQDAAVLSPSDIPIRLKAVLGEPSREFDAVDSSSRGEGSHFVLRLQRRLTEAVACWDAIAQGSGSQREMEFLLGAAHGQAQLIHLEKLIALLGEVRATVRAAFGRKHPSPEQYQSVASALAFAVHATGAPPYDADRDVQPMVQRLRKSQLGD